MIERYEAGEKKIGRGWSVCGTTEKNPNHRREISKQSISESLGYHRVLSICAHLRNLCFEIQLHLLDIEIRKKLIFVFKK